MSIVELTVCFDIDSSMVKLGCVCGCVVEFGYGSVFLQWLLLVKIDICMHI